MSAQTLPDIKLLKQPMTKTTLNDRSTNDKLIIKSRKRNLRCQFHRSSRLKKIFVGVFRVFWPEVGSHPSHHLLRLAYLIVPGFGFSMDRLQDISAVQWCTRSKPRCPIYENRKVNFS